MSAIKRIQKELKHLFNTPVTNTSVIQKDDPFCLEVTLNPPSDSLYANRTFNATILLSDKYPDEAPKVWFTTPVYHFNINQQNGTVCFSFLQNWESNIYLEDIILALYTLFLRPDPKSPADQELYREYVEQTPIYNTKAKKVLTSWAQ